MTMLQPFAFEDQLVRVIDQDGEPWFVGKDVCRALDISKHRDALSRLDEDERGSVIVDSLGGPQETTIISEPGVYRLVFTSRKEAAERFKRWLAHEVLPAIRKTGRYEAPGAGEALLPGHPSFNEAVRLVAEARRINGPGAALAIWRKLGLPDDEALDKREAASPPDPRRDDVVRFLTEETEPDAHGTPARALFQHFQRFARETGLDFLTEAAFGRTLVSLGIPRRKASINRYFVRVKERVLQ